jgi:CRISPR system Cascade subunit CasC
MAVPEARKNSMMGQNPPAYVLGLIRTGQPLSLVNAFESPIYSKKGFVENSIQALENHFEHVKQTYNIESNEFRIPELDLNEFCKGVLNYA